MANVIKHKRGSGSDPSASDLVVGEVAIRTDVGKLFTKMDNGSVAEIAGGGSDIAINTLSSSSGTGGGSASFNGSAYRFTLSSPPSVSAQQLLVSINGVIQKPVAGTGQPSEGFSVDGNDIILGDAPETGSDFFILTFKSLGVSEPADNSVTSAKIVDGTIVNADINASAAIAGSKISPDFGSQDIVTTGNLDIAQDIRHIGDTDTGIAFDTDQVALKIGGVQRLTISSSNIQLSHGNGVQIAGSLRMSQAGGLFAVNNSSGTDTFTVNSSTGNVNTVGTITGSGNLTIDTNTLHVDSSNNRVGIGTTSPTNKLSLVGSDSGDTYLQIANSTTGSDANSGFLVGLKSDEGATLYQLENNYMRFGTNGTERMRIDSSGNVGIGTTSPDTLLHLSGADTAVIRLENSDNSLGADQLIGGLEFEKTDPSGAGAGVVGGLRMYSSDVIGSAAYLTLSTSNSTTNNEEHVRITSDGKVGIGTTSPDTKLHLEASNNGVTAMTSANNRLRFTDTDTTVTSNQPTGVIEFESRDSGNEGIQAYIACKGSNTGQGSLHFATGKEASSTLAERMTIDQSGNVGINDSSPRAELSVAAVSGNAPHIDIGQAASNNFKLGYDSGHCILGAAASAGDFIFKNNVNSDGHPGGSGTELMRIDSSGDTEINSENDKGLFVKTDGNNAAVRLRATGGSDSGGFRINHNAPNSLLLFDRISSNGVFASTLVTLDSSGNVGIGTTSPSSLFNVDGGSANSAIEIDGTGRYRGFEIHEGGTRKAYFQHDATDNLTRLQTLESNLVFLTSDVEQMRLSGSNLGVGTSSPVNNSGYGGITLNGSSGAIFSFKDSDVEKTRLSLVADNTFSIQYPPGNSGIFRIDQLTADGSGNITGATERMRVTNDGKVFIGHTNRNGVDATTSTLSVTGNTSTNTGNVPGSFFGGAVTSQRFVLAFSNNNGVVGSISTNGTQTQFNDTSDYRLKENVVPLSNAITRIKALKPSRFNFITDATRTLDGFLAHEVAEVVPEAVAGEKDGMAGETYYEEGDTLPTGKEYGDVKTYSTTEIHAQGLDQSKLVPLLVAALQEAIGRIEALEAK